MRRVGAIGGQFEIGRKPLPTLRVGSWVQLAVCGTEFATKS